MLISKGFWIPISVPSKLLNRPRDLSDSPLITEINPPPQIKQADYTEKFSDLCIKEFET